MRSHPRLVAPTLLAVAGFLTAITVHAHPGHDHSDIPSLIRHPLAGSEHVLGSAAVGLAVAGLIYLATRRVRMPALARWTGLSVVAIAVTVGLTV